jgi:energy-coupling factor transporter ATP-binding protein EcfA2
MFIHSVLLEKFKNILHLTFEAKGNHVVITGPNGAGKTTILEALLTLFFGKKLLPDDPIMHGHESSPIECGLCDEKGGKISFRVKAKISGSGFFGIEVTTFNHMGMEMSIKKPMEFLAGIITRDFIDPEEFCSKSGKERIAMLYRLIPGLQASIDALQKEYEEEQFKRSQINIDRKRLDGELLNIPPVDGLPSCEIDPADLLSQVQDAESHNFRRSVLTNAVENCRHDVAVRKEMIEMVQKNIESLKRQIAEKEQELATLAEQQNISSEALKGWIEELDAFVPKDVSELREQIANLSATNESIRKNLRRKELEKQIEAKGIEYSFGLDRMREIENKKVKVYQEAHMPIEGLAVGDTDITFPDPISGERVAFGSLSTGQKYMVGIPILAAFLPPAEKGLRCMIIQDANAMDPNNFERAMEAANAAKVQLVMHRTSQTKEQNKLEIIIEEEACSHEWEYLEDTGGCDNPRHIYVCKKCQLKEDR